MLDLFEPDSGLEVANTTRIDTSDTRGRAFFSDTLGMFFPAALAATSWSHRCCAWARQCTPVLRENLRGAARVVWTLWGWTRSLSPPIVADAITSTPRYRCTRYEGSCYGLP